jgi:solute:Na+ symporter, SSS family
MKLLAISDYLVFIFYFLIVAGYGFYIHRKRKKEIFSRDYFLAEGSLTWWAIGASLIASNISAEQFIGMSGSGFKMGLAIATYEWIGGFTLLLVAIYFIPIYLKNNIFTMPQYLQKRYNGQVAMIMSVFWLLLYVFVNLTSILYLGAIAISSITGLNLTLCMLFLAVFAIVVTLGGMRVIGYTDVIQVFFLIVGGLATTYFTLKLVAEQFDSSGVFAGFSLMKEHAADHFHMILKKDNPNYMDLPGLSVLIGGMLIINLNYWGCNQYITQRALGADLKTARNGILFAAFLKLLMPLIVVIPGIAAFTLYQNGSLQTEMLQDGAINPDRAYPTLLNLLPVGLKGLSFAALTAAIVASLAGKANSIATIFSLDIYKKNLNESASEVQLVKIGKITVVISMLIAMIVAPLMGIDQKGGFQYIQEYTGFVSPGIFAMFFLGFFWKKTTSNAALFAIVGGFLLSILFKLLPQFCDLEFLNMFGFAVPNSHGVYEIPFVDRMGFVFVLCVLTMVLISLYEIKKGVIPNSLEFKLSWFKVTPAFRFWSLIFLGSLAALYALFW